MTKVTQIKFELNPQFLYAQIHCENCNVHIPRPRYQRSGHYLCTGCIQLMPRVRPWVIPDSAHRGPLATLINVLSGTNPQEESNGNSTIINTAAGPGARTTRFNSKYANYTTRGKYANSPRAEGTQAQDGYSEAFRDPVEACTGGCG